MPILAMSAGTVTAIWGNAFIRLADGSLKPVKVGDKVAGGERIITDADGLVEISPAKGHPQLVKAHVQPDAQAVDKAVAGIEAQDPQEAPAAGLTGGAEGGMQPGLRVERVTENVSASSSGVSDANAAAQADAPQTGSFADQRTLVSEPLPQARINDIVANEGTGTATFTVTLDKASNSTVTIPFSTKEGTAAEGGDFTPAKGLITFLPGETSKTVTVAITNDERYEGEERFTVQLGTPTNATLGKGEGAVLIHDDGTGAVTGNGVADDDRPHATVTGGQASEGGTLEFHIKLTNDSTTETAVTLKLTGTSDHPVSLTDDLAAISIFQGPDHLLVPYEVGSDGSLLLRVAALTQAGTDYSVQIDTKTDALAESAEHLQLAVSTPYDATPVVATGTIIDVPPPGLSIDDAIVNEGTGTATFTVTLSGPSTVPVTVNFHTDNGTALAGEDYTASQGTLTFAPGQTSQTISVPIVNDARYEGEEAFQIKLDAPTNAALSKAAGTIAIHDDGTGTAAGNGAALDDDRPRVSVSDAQASEGGVLDFHITLSHESTAATPMVLKLTGVGDHPVALGQDTDTTVIVQQAALSPDGTGWQYLDLPYQIDNEGNLLLSVPPLTSPDADILVRVVTKTDALVEGPETVELAVSTPHDTAPVFGLGLIDDNLPYSISGEPTHEGGKVGFNVMMTDPSTVPVAVHLSLDSGVDDPLTLDNESAKLGVDTGSALEWESAPGVWQAVTGPLTFEPGSTSIHVRLATVDDQAPEATEFIKLLATFDDPRFDKPITVTNQTAIDDNDQPWFDPVDPNNSHPDPSQIPLDTSKEWVGAVDKSDVFAWHLSDHGVDTVHGFDGRAALAGGDVLDLRDILQGEEAANADLTHFLHFDTSGPDTVIKIAGLGDMVDGHSASNTDSQHIVLEGVNLPMDLGLGAGATDAHIIAKLMQQGNLLVDHA